MGSSTFEIQCMHVLSDQGEVFHRDFSCQSYKFENWLLVQAVEKDKSCSFFRERNSEKS